MPKIKKDFHLTNFERIKGLRFCYDNAISLLEEAIILQKHQKWARATALAILGLEEFAKIEMIAETFSIKYHSEWKKFEKQFLSHNTKLTKADSLVVQILLRKGEEKKFSEILTEIFQGRSLNIAKQKCIYVGYSLQFSWEVPLKIVEENDSKEVISLLELLKNTYSETFAGSDNDLVELVKRIRKPNLTDEADKFHKDLRAKVIKKYEEVLKIKVKPDIHNI